MIFRCYRGSCCCCCCRIHILFLTILIGYIITIWNYFIHNEIVWNQYTNNNKSNKSNQKNHHYTSFMNHVINKYSFDFTMDSNNNNNNKDGFAGCLLIMDDNHYLIEWLAYHYYVLPLKYLIVAIDPRSRTSPKKIFQRYNKDHNLFMNITIWDKDSDYVTNSTEWEEASYWVRANFGGIQEINHPYLSKELIQHRTRQRLFYYKCIREHKTMNRHWTILTDSDEYILINYPTINHLIQQHNNNNNDTTIQQVLPYVPNITEYGSVLKFLQNPTNRKLFFPLQENTTTTNTEAWIPNDTPCIQIPRRRFGTIESPEISSVSSFRSQQQGDWIQNVSSNMLTLRWFKHASDTNYYYNRISKVIIDLSQIQNVSYTIQPVNSIHRPIPDYCKRRKLHIRANEQVFIINHYLGTFQQYTYRDNDSRINDIKNQQERSIDKYQKTSRLQQGTSTDIRPWLTGFLTMMGNETAHYLLHNVGILEPY